MGSAPGTEKRKIWDSASTMIAFHLSVPYRSGSVMEENVRQALTEGTIENIRSPAKEILAALFVENTPSIIFRAAMECGSSLEKVRIL